MKKQLLSLLALLLINILAFSQSPNYELSNGGTKPANGMSQWIRSKDFGSMQFRVACISGMDKNGLYTWTIDFKSTYSEGNFEAYVGPNFEAIKHTFETGEYGESTEIGTTMQDINPNKTYHFRGDFKVNSNRSFYIVFTTMNVQPEASRFGPPKYEAMDNGLPSLMCQMDQFEGCPNFGKPKQVSITSYNYGQMVTINNNMNAQNSNSNTDYSRYNNSQQSQIPENKTEKTLNSVLEVLEKVNQKNPNVRQRKYNN